MRFFDDIPIWAKAFAATAILLVSLLGMGLNAYRSLDRSAQDLSRLSQLNLPKQQAVLDLTHDITTTHIKIFRLVTWASNGVNPSLLESLRFEVVSDVDLLKAHILRLGSRPDINDAERATLETTAEKWEKYLQAAKDTVEVSISDAPMAAMMLGGTDEDFQEVAVELRIMSALVSNQTRLVAQELSSAADRSKTLVGAGGLLGLLIAVLVSLFLGRSLIIPIRSVTQAMKQVSAGDANIKLGYSHRKDEIGEMVKSVAVFRENLERQNALLTRHEEEARTQNLRFEMALANMSQGLSMFDADQNLIISNDRYARLYGMSPELVKPGTPFENILNHTHKQFEGESLSFVQQRVASAGETSSWRRLQQMTDGRIIYLTRCPMPGGGWVATHEDVTEQRRMEARIAYMAHHDSLTGLANRMLLRDRLEVALEEAKEGGRPVIVLMLDLDRFKEVNDTLGHTMGDALLKAVAERLRGCLKREETVARLGGDEFIILKPSSDPEDEATELALRISSVLRAPFMLDEHRAIMGTSIGIAIAPQDGSDPDQILKHADLALYQAKSEGRGTHAFFHPDMDHRMQERLALERDMRNALVEREFDLAYQPIVRLDTNQVVGCEALLRWRHPERGNVPPAAFIPLAEETGLIVPIGEWALRQACAEAATWPEHISIAVNVSAAQFREGYLASLVLGALASAGLATNRLELEVTETALLANDEATLAELHKLRSLGVRVALDDFGTGYSSLSYLRRFPFDKIKIDRSFVADVAGTAGGSSPILRSITMLGESLGMVTTAEGVETQEQLERVRAVGCVEVQGFYLSRPKTAREIGEMFVMSESGAIPGKQESHERRKIQSS